MLRRATFPATSFASKCSNVASNNASCASSSTFLFSRQQQHHAASYTQRALFSSGSNSTSAAAMTTRRFLHMRHAAATSTSYVGLHQFPTLVGARRFQSSSTAEQKQQQGEQQQQQGEQKGENANNTNGGSADGSKTAGGEKPQQSNNGFRAQIAGILRDIKEFPDIYNGPNMLSLAFFTIFCLSSTGTQVEANWWLKHWAVDMDSHLRPWSMALHSLHMNNFLSMVFSILLLHNSLHPLTHGLAGGSAALMQYCGLVAVLSGASIWAFQQVWYDPTKKDVLGQPMKGEKQFGPWDIAAAVMVMQYLRLGIAPHRLLLSFNGWVKYACCVGAVCILYYDPQPVFFGTIFGFLLCRFAPAFRGIATV